MTEEYKREVITEFLILFIENLIKDIELQGATSITTNDLRKFIQNIETNKKVIGKRYEGKIDN